MRLTSILATIFALSSAQLLYAAPLPSVDMASHEVAAEPAHTSRALTSSGVQELHQVRLERRIHIARGNLNAMQHGQQVLVHQDKRKALNDLAKTHDTARDRYLEHAQEAEGRRDYQNAGLHRQSAAQEHADAERYRGQANLESLAMEYHGSMNKAITTSGTAASREEKVEKHINSNPKKAAAYQKEANALHEEAADHRMNAQAALDQLTPHLHG
ncbi:hypothetical protein FRB91_001560 [Serendipita sp. 411]|nr:hypothetical protein FRC19_001280 [Serendipita sp. 401]KAG8845682.1 hypothetical protein FRB91_001560 [Serendipita sp. 411]KAG9043843.1 hypothetical protein FS842_001696 [Serendipita sp. 407]